MKRKYNFYLHLTRAGITANMVTLLRVLMALMLIPMGLHYGPATMLLIYCPGMLLDVVDGKLANFQSNRKPMQRELPRDATFIQIMLYQGKSWWGAMWDARCDKMYYLQGLFVCWWFVQIPSWQAAAAALAVFVLIATRQIKSIRPQWFSSDQSSNLIGQVKAWVEAFYVIIAIATVTWPHNPFTGKLGFHWHYREQIVLVMFILAVLFGFGSWVGHVFGLKLQYRDIKFWNSKK